MLSHFPLAEVGPRGAVGGCNTPGSRVDPWWNPGSLFPTVSTPGPPKIENDEGSPGEINQQLFEQQNPIRKTPSPSISSHPLLSSTIQHQIYQQSNSSNANHHKTSNINHNNNNNTDRNKEKSRRTFDCINSIGNNSSSSNNNNNQEINKNLYFSKQSNNLLSTLLAPKSTDSSHLSRGVDHSTVNSRTVLSSLLNTTSPNLVDYTNSPSISTLVATSVKETETQIIDTSIVSPSPVSSSSSRDSFIGIVSSLNSRIKSEGLSRNSHVDDLPVTGTGFCASLLSSLLSTSKISTPKSVEDVNNSSSIEHLQLDQESKVEYSLSASSPQQNVLEVSTEDLIATSPYNIISTSIESKCNLSKNLIKNSSNVVVSPSSGITIDMKYETQPAPPTGPPHLTTAGVEPPHSSQTSGLVVGASPAEVVGVDSLLLPWTTTSTDFLEPSDVKQTAAGIQDAWDTLLLGSSVGVASAQSLAELKPLPPFTGYTGHLSINGIPGHHYHTIASSAERPSMQSSSPTPSSNQEYYESPVVSSSTPCPQGNQKSQQQQQQQSQQQHPHHHHHHHHHHHQHHHQQTQQQQQQPQPQQQQQQLPQSTQQVDYDIEDIAEIIGSAIADTTVPSGGGGNGPGSEHDPDGSRDWIDIAEWIDTECSPKTHETTSPNPYSQIYSSTNPNSHSHQHGSTLQSLLTTGYAPLLQARLQAGNTGLQNTSCGETPSSTSPYPPVSPPGRVSTSCSPDHLLHSSFATPSHPRKRSRPSPGNQNPSKKSPAAAALPYGTESGLISGKEKPVHRCSICNRGFLNKSNIKVHLRTHTGEKPFRCEVCGKAFRQKAHLIKHQQIHKRIGRD